MGAVPEPVPEPVHGRRHPPATTFLPSGSPSARRVPHHLRFRATLIEERVTVRE